MLVISQSYYSGNLSGCGDILSQETSAIIQQNIITIECENISPSTKRRVQTIGTKPANIMAILYVILAIVHR